MKRLVSEMTIKQAAGRLTAFIVAVVFALGTLFVPTGTLAAATESDETAGNEVVETETPAGESATDEGAVQDAAETGPAEADQAETGAGEEAQEGSQPEAEASDAAALEELVQAHDENGDAAALEDLDQDDYDGFIYKLEDSVTKQEVREMETAIDRLGEDTQSGSVEELIKNELYTADSIETIEAVAAPDMIEYIEPDYVISLTGTNDPGYENYGWYLDMIKAPYAWSRNAFGEGAVVAVLDTGAEMTHPDFENTSFVDPYNAVDGSDNVTDSIGHGTGVAGIIAASYNNGRGLTGVMPKASVMPVKVFDDEEEKAKHSWVINGIDYAAAHGADVINLSIGDEKVSASMNDACSRAAAKGVIVVAAVGNDGGSTLMYPASYSSVVSVGSIEASGAHSDFSHHNKYVDVTAPGRGILIPSKSKYYTMTGTSVSAPQVAAMAAMVKSMDPSVNSAGFKEILRATCIDKGKAGRDDYFGYGLMDLSRAYRYMTGSLILYKASLSCTSYVYNGKPRSPAVTVKRANETLTNADYKVTYQSKRTAVGTYKVTITGLGKYTGDKILKYKILPPLVKKIKTPKRYKKKLKVRWYAMSSGQKIKYRSAITGFQVRVSKSSKFTKAKYVKVKGSTKTSATVKGLKRKTKYYVQYRAYKKVGSVTYYSKWSGKKKVKTK